MSEAEETLAAELSASASMAWTQLACDGHVAADRGGRTARRHSVDADGRPRPRHARRRTRAPSRLRGRTARAGRRSGAGVRCSMNAIKGEANVVNRRRGWAAPLDASLFGNVVATRRVRRHAGRRWWHRSPTSAAGFVRAKARVHGHGESPAVVGPGRPVAGAGAGGRGTRPDVGDRRASLGTYARRLWLARRPVRRAVDRRRPPTRQGGRRIRHAVRRRPFAGAAQLDGSFDAVQTIAHELGHAYHNTQLGPARDCSVHCRWRWRRRRASSARR